MSTIPPLPQYWVFAPFTITGTNGRKMRARLFATLRRFGVDISSTPQAWKYRLQFCEGAALLDIEAFFFQREKDVIVDINLLSGDRWVWHRLKARLSGSERNYLPMSPFLTGKIVVERLRRGNFADRDFEWLGSDIPVDWLLPYLKSKDLNIVRQAMERLCLRKYEGDDSEIEKWQTVKTERFIEREIQKHARQIGQATSHL